MQPPVKFTKISKNFFVQKFHQSYTIRSIELSFLLAHLLTFILYLLLVVKFLCLLLVVDINCLETNCGCSLGLGFVAAETNAAEILQNSARRPLNPPSPVHGLRRMYSLGINTTVPGIARVRRVARCTFPIQHNGASCPTRPSFGNPVCAPEIPVRPISTSPLPPLVHKPRCSSCQRSFWALLSAVPTTEAQKTSISSIPTAGFDPCLHSSSLLFRSPP